MIQFLEDRRFLQERLVHGIELHLNDNELKEFQAIAKQYDKDRYFTIYGCQSCVQTLVKFVFDNYDKSLKDGQKATATPDKDIPRAKRNTRGLE